MLRLKTRMVRVVLMLLSAIRATLMPVTVAWRQVPVEKNQSIVIRRR